MKDLTFKVSSGLKNIIGKELITNDLIAIFELVKNSYDADARSVRIVFKDVSSEKKDKGKIYVIDDGYGMDYDDLEKKWLFVGFSEKKEADNQKDDKAPKASDFRDKIENRRMLAGAKGIGRFSCDKLGGNLNLYTKKIGEKGTHVLKVDWSDFELDQSKQFGTINAEYDTVEFPGIPGVMGQKDYKKGTILEITGLNAPWDETKLLKLRRYLQRLINPENISGEDRFTISLEAPDFAERDKHVELHKVINGPVSNFVFEKLEVKTTRLGCDISEDGKTVTCTLEDKGRFVFSLEESNPYPRLKNLSVKLFYLNRTAKQQFTTLMGIEPVNYGSIFLYKNGIRIHPYGDEADDWLGLDRRKAQGQRRFLSNREMMGRVEINGPQSEFREVSSRDGGVEHTEAYFQLLDFIVNHAIKRLELYVVEGLHFDSPQNPVSEAELRKRSIAIIGKVLGKDVSSIKVNDDITEILKEKELEITPRAIESMEDIVEYIKDSAKKKEIVDKIKAAKKIAEKLAKEAKARQEEIDRLNKEAAIKEQQILIYKERNPSAIKYEEVFHTIRISTGRINDKIRILMSDEKTLENKDDLKGELAAILFEANKIKTMSMLMDRAKFKMDQNVTKSDIVAYISQYLAHISAVPMTTSKFEHIPQIDMVGNDVQFVTEFNPILISVVLDNLVSNSAKAGASIILFEFRLMGKDLTMRVHDNGRGVDKNNEKYLFKLGFTTTKFGTGFGLFHMKTALLESKNASIKFIGNGQNAELPGACFEVVFHA